MKIDISRVNLLEKDIEDWLYENPGALAHRFAGPYVEKWLARQYSLPSGIADLIGVDNYGVLAVVEVKNVPINKAAVLQVCRYAVDLREVIFHRTGYKAIDQFDNPVIRRLLVGPSIDNQTFTEAEACEVDVFQFSVTLDLAVGVLNWTSDQRVERDMAYLRMSRGPEWEMFGIHRHDVAPPVETPHAHDEFDELLDALLAEDHHRARHNQLDTPEQ